MQVDYFDCFNNEQRVVKEKLTFFLKTEDIVQNNYKSVWLWGYLHTGLIIVYRIADYKTEVHYNNKTILCT